MRVSTAGRYGLRMMLDLALSNNPEAPILRQDIAARQDISSEYLAQLSRGLSRAGLIRSYLGPGGGYVLNRPPADIYIGEVFRAVEGPIAPVACVLPDGKAACPRAGTCAAQVLWLGLAHAIERYLDSISLDDLCFLAHQLEASPEIDCANPADAFLQSIEKFGNSSYCRIELNDPHTSQE